MAISRSGREKRKGVPLILSQVIGYDTMRI
jgi:hypothetical protein